MAEGLTIPLLQDFQKKILSDFEKYIPTLADNISTVADLLTKDQKDRIREYKNDQKILENEQEIRRVLESIDKPKPVEISKIPAIDKFKAELSANFEKYVPVISKNMGSMSDLLTKDQKEKIKQYETQQDLLEKQDDIKKILESANKPKMLKLQEKLTESYHKFIVKNKWFEKSIKFFESMSKKAGNWLIDILKAVLLLAIFDPKGKFLNSIIDFILKMVVNLINFLMKYLPVIVNRMVFLIEEVIPKVLKKIISVIFPLIGSIFKDIAKKFPEGSVIRQIFTWIGEAFDKNGVLYKFFSFLAENFKYIVLILGALAILQPLFSIAGFLIKAIPIIINLVQGLSVAFTTLSAFLIANPIVAIIAGIIILITLIIVFRKEIVKFFKFLWEKIKPFLLIIWNFFYKELIGPIVDLVKNFSIGKLIKVLFQTIFLVPRLMIKYLIMPIVNAIAPILKKYLIEPIVNFFKFILSKIKAFGNLILSFFKPLIDAIKNLFTNFSFTNIVKLMKTILSFYMIIPRLFYKNVIKPVIDNFKKLGSLFYDSVIQPLLNFVKDSWIGKAAGGIKNIAGGAVDFIGNFFKTNPIGKAIARFFDTVMDKLFMVLTDIGTFFKGITTYGIFGYFKLNKKETKGLYDLGRIEAKTGMSEEQMLRLSPAELRKNSQDVQDLVKAMQETNKLLQDKKLEKKDNESLAQVTVRTNKSWELREYQTNRTVNSEI